MSWAKRLGGRLPDFADVVQRFPIAVLIMAVFTAWIIFQQFNDGVFEEDAHIFGGFILCGYIAVIMTLISEARGWKRPKGLMLGISVGLPTFLVCYLAKHLDFNVPMAIAAAIIFLGNAAAFRKARQDSNVWNFSQKLWTGAMFAAVGSMIFGLGMVAITEAVSSLFGLEIYSLVENIILPIGLAFLAPLYWLGTLPRYGDVEDVSELSFEARALSFLGTWMLAPLVVIYSLIILAYGVKVLIQWELPKGEIAALVTPFLGVGMLVWLMLEPKIMKESGFVRFYRRVWHWVMLLAAILLAIAVFVRIREYGFTIERFLLTLILIWAFAQSAWFTLKPLGKRDIRIPTCIAASLLMFGAFAAEPISSTHQFMRAKAAKQALTVFNATSLRENPEIAKQFRGSVDYLIRKKDEKRFEALLPNVEMPGSVYGSDYKELMRSLGGERLKDGKFINNQTVDLTGMERLDVTKSARLYFTDFLYLNSTTHFDDKSDIITQGRGFEVTYNLDNNIITIDFDALFESASEAENLGNRLPLLLTTETGSRIELYFSGGDLTYENDKLTRAAIAPVFVIPD